MDAEERKYWVIVASKDHVEAGKAIGIVQACHGRSQGLSRMRKGDGVLCYSGKQSLSKPDKCQKFTGMGTVTDEAVYQVELSENFCPARRNVAFLPAADVDITPLIEDLEFILNKQKWGYVFRFGFFEINKKDFNLISSKMIPHV